MNVIVMLSLLCVYSSNQSGSDTRDAVCRGDRSIAIPTLRI